MQNIKLHEVIVGYWNELLHLSRYINIFYILHFPFIRIAVKLNENWMSQCDSNNRHMPYMIQYIICFESTLTKFILNLPHHILYLHINA